MKDKLRQYLMKVTASDYKVFLYLHLLHSNDESFEVRASLIEQSMDLNVATIHLAIRNLVKAKLLIVISKKLDCGRGKLCKFSNEWGQNDKL